LHVPQTQRTEAGLPGHVAEHRQVTAQRGQRCGRGRVGAATQVVDQYAGERWRLAALGELPHGEVNNRRKRGWIMAVAGQHGNQGRREGTRHRGVEPGGDLRPDIWDQSFNHHRIAALASDLDRGDEILEQGVEIPRTHALLGHREGHRVRHVEVQQRPGKIGGRVRAVTVEGLHDRLDETDCDAVPTQRLNKA
jgi:hypothetical protein